jgi:hypothetical protein
MVAREACRGCGGWRDNQQQVKLVLDSGELCLIWQQ